MAMTDDQQHAFYTALARDRVRGPRIGLDTPEQVAEHATKIGGELALRLAIARGDFTEGGARVAQAWVDEQERLRVHAGTAASVAAAEKAARWAMWSSLISAATGIVAAATYWLSRAM